MEQQMDDRLARAAATDAGRRNAIKNGRPPRPWTLDDYNAASREYWRIVRLHRLPGWDAPMMPD